AELIENNVDFDLLKEASDRSLLVLNAVDLATGDVVRYDNRRHGPATLKKALLASSSEPVFMDPVQIGDRTLVDGGVRDLVPLAAAFESGVEVDAMVVIVTNPLEAERLTAPPSSGLDILGRTVEILLAETGLNDLCLAQTLNALVRVARNARDAGLDDAVLFEGVDASYAEAVDDLRSVPIVPVAPRERLELDSLDFEPGAMSRLFDLGVERGRQVLAPLLADWPPPIFEL
ncbi:MAG TPA: patatin-like phospholipase family protein, partial [Planctomycetota bacterium]|nr:patatin-like phospholipase family protein [Planctomycetota bacterium]